MKILIATRNAHKLKEFHQLFENFRTKTGSQIQLVTLNAFPDIPEAEETGKSFEENAVQKALTYARQIRLLAVADDSGLTVDALGGAPGIYSARYAGDGKDDRANCEKLLHDLREVPDQKRQAQFRCAIAVAAPDKLVGIAKGEVSGVILHQLKGNNGFGYDPLFYYPPFGKTFAEAASAKKNMVSHRAKALKTAKLILNQFLTPR